jgi:hypothetical protein
MHRNRGLLTVVVLVAVVASGCEIIRSSVSTTGVQANAPSYDPSISANARFVAFSSAADNLTAGDTNSTADVFVRDERDDTTSLVSVGSSGEPANGASSSPVISANGRFVAFRSSATNLVANAPDVGIYLRDLELQVTRLVSRGADRAALPVTIPTGLAISATGRFVAFLGDFSVFRFDRAVGFATSVWPGLREPTGLSADGRYLVSDTVVVVGVHALVAVVSDLETQEVVYAGPVDSWGIEITPDGKHVVYAYAPNCFPSFFPTCTAGPSGARIVDLESGHEQAVVTKLGQPYADVQSMGISDSSERVALITADNAYLFDRRDGSFILVSWATNHLETGDRPSAQATISGDGTTVAFSSEASNLVEHDTNGLSDVFTRYPVPNER